MVEVYSRVLYLNVVHM